MSVSLFQLKEIAESVDYGVTASASNKPIGPKFLRITDIQNGHVNWSEVPWCKCDTKETKSAKLQSGDIVFARTGATTGKSYLITNCPENTVFASYLIRVRLSQTADPSYVSHFFQTAFYWSQINKSARGAAQPGVNATKLKSLQIPIPPLEEQKRIASILDAADALRSKRREALARLDDLLQSTFLDLFGDPVNNPKGWELRNLGEIATLQRGFDLPVQMRSEGRVPIFAANGSVGTHNTYKVKGPGVVTGRSGTLGKVHYVEENFWPLNTALWVKDFHGNNPVWICQLLRLMRLEQFTRGAGVPTLNRNLVHVVKMPLPPLDLQRRFAKIVSSVEEQKAKMRKHLEQLDDLFASLQQRAFRGDL